MVSNNPGPVIGKTDTSFLRLCKESPVLLSAWEVICQHKDFTALFAVPGGKMT